MNKTSIEWTHRPETRGAAGGMTWNPIRARIKGNRKGGTFCTRTSPGCKNCYASVINIRFGNGLEFAVPNLEKIEFFIDERILEEPLKAKKPCTIFVGDMFDLFHEAIPVEMIVRVLEVCSKRHGHTIQILTKRAARMQAIVTDISAMAGCDPPEWLWFGVSVEDRPRADERIPLLLQTPAAVRFLSVEPQLEEIDLTLTNALGCGDSNHKEDGIGGGMCSGVDWVICGGESGPGARPFNLAWAESLLAQCRAAGVPFFMKQVGSHVIQGGERRVKRDRKGGDMHEWPHELRVREFPLVQSREAVCA